jgi:hypothetical protein
LTSVVAAGKMLNDSESSVLGISFGIISRTVERGSITNVTINLVEIKIIRISNALLSLDETPVFGGLED